MLRCYLENIIFTHNFVISSILNGNLSYSECDFCDNFYFLFGWKRKYKI